jgi:hypothetical protein
LSAGKATHPEAKQEVTDYVRVLGRERRGNCEDYREEGCE